MSLCLLGVVWSETSSGYEPNVHVQNSRRCGEVELLLVKQRSVPAVKSVSHQGAPSQPVTREEGGDGHCYHCHQERDPVTALSLPGEACVTRNVLGDDTSHLSPSKDVIHLSAPHKGEGDLSQAAVQRWGSGQEFPPVPGCRGSG